MNSSATKVNQVMPFVKAVIETFKVMVHIKVIQGGIRLFRQPGTARDYSAIIGFNGDLEGTLTLALSKTTAEAIVCAFLGEKQVSELLVTDAVGELANIIASLAKKEFSDIEYNITLPTVVRGVGHVISNHADDEKIVTSFTCPFGGFDLEVFLEKTRR